MFCPTCGKELSDSASFCSKCGTKIATAAVNPTAQVTNSEQGAMQSAQTAVAAHAPMQPQNVSAQTPAQKPASNKRRNIIIACVIVVVVALVVGIVGYNMWQADQQKKTEERTAQIQESVDGIMQEANALTVNTGEGADRATLLAQYATLQSAKDALASEQQQGNFALPNGSSYDITQDVDYLESQMAGIRAWFEQSYTQSLAAASFAEGDTAESLSSSACQQKLDALTALKATIEQEKAIWGDDTGASSTYANLINQIDAQIAKGNELLPQITTREEEEAKNSRGFIGSWAWSSMGGGTPMINVITFYEDGRFLSQMRMTQTTSTWSLVGQASDGRVTVQTDPTTYTYNPETDTLVTGDGSMTYTRADGPIG